MDLNTSLNTTNTASTTAASANSERADRPSLENIVASRLAPLGYEAIQIELMAKPSRVVRIFIDFLDPKAGTIGIEDCAKSSRALDEALDAYFDAEKEYATGYELEVSSPGIDRPLAAPKDFVRFQGREVRIHTFRPLTAEDTQNPGYHAKNPRQKNFLGTLVQYEISTESARNKKTPGTIWLQVSPQSAVAAPDMKVAIPHDAVAKAHLEPDFSELTHPSRKDLL